MWLPTRFIASYFCTWQRRTLSHTGSTIRIFRYQPRQIKHCNIQPCSKSSFRERSNAVRRVKGLLDLQDVQLTVHAYTLTSHTHSRNLAFSVHLFSRNSQILRSLRAKSYLISANPTVNLESTDINLFKPMSKMWLLLSRFSRTRQFLNSIICKSSMGLYLWIIWQYLHASGIADICNYNLKEFIFAVKSLLTLYCPVNVLPGFSVCEL